MADRLYSAQIKYPFVSAASPEKLAGVLDCLFYVSPQDIAVTPPFIPTGLDDVGAWLYDVNVTLGAYTYYSYTFYVKVPDDPDVYNMDEDFPATTYSYYSKTFIFAVDDGATMKTVRSTEDERSALSVNVEQVATPAGPVGQNLMDAAVVVPCPRRVSQIRLYNEFRASDPADRDELPPDFLQEKRYPGHVVMFNDGYNCNVSYNESTGTLRFTGGLGFGLGRPDYNPWDDTDENLDDGVRDVNGVNTQGEVPIEPGGGLTLDTTVPGQLRIFVRNQGDLACPPE